MRPCLVAGKSLHVLLPVACCLLPDIANNSVAQRESLSLERERLHSGRGAQGQ